MNLVLIDDPAEPISNTGYEQQLGYTSLNQFATLKGLPFYDWQKVTNDSKGAVSVVYQSRDFNHAIGLPRKNGMAYPLFDYERLLYESRVLKSGLSDATTLSSFLNI